MRLKRINAFGLALLVILQCEKVILNTDNSQWDIEKQAASLGKGLNIHFDDTSQRPIIDSCIKAASELGFNSIRISADWVSHSLQTLPYTIDPLFFPEIDHIVQTVQFYNLSCVICMDDIDSLVEARQPQKENYASIFEQISRHYKDNGVSLFFEINAATQKFLSTELRNQYYNEAIAQIRKTNPYRSLIIGIPAGLQNTSSTDPVFTIDKFSIISFRYYNPVQFTHQGLPSVTGSSIWKGMPWPLSGSDTDKIHTDFNQFKSNWQNKWSLPVFISEFGSSDYADLFSRSRWNRAVVRQCQSYRWSMAYNPFCTIQELSEMLRSDSLKPLFKSILNPEWDSTESVTPGSNDTLQPKGDYVLLDDFENIFNAQPGMNHLGASRQFAQRTTFTKSGWYAMGNDSTTVYSFDSVPLLRWDEWYKNGLEHNGALLIGPYGLSGNGVYGRYHVKAVGNSYAFAGCGTSFSGEYYTNKIDFTDLTAITFWARGKGYWRVMVLTDTIDQGYPKEDQWGHFGIDFEPTNNWRQFVFWTKDFKPMNFSRAKKEKLQWSEACKKSTFFEFITSQEYGQEVDEMLELQVDEIRLYGVSYEKTFGFAYPTPDK